MENKAIYAAPHTDTTPISVGYHSIWHDIQIGIIGCPTKMIIKSLLILNLLTSAILADFGGIQLSKERASSEDGVYQVVITPFQGFPKAAALVLRRCSETKARGTF